MVEGLLQPGLMTAAIGTFFWFQTSYYSHMVIPLYIWSVAGIKQRLRNQYVSTYFNEALRQADYGNRWSKSG
jgi:hypothetical protein